MREEKKRIITQWMFPIIVLVVIVAGMIINFNIRSADIAASSIEKDMIIVTERYSAELSSYLAVMSNATKAAAEAIYHLGSNAGGQSGQTVEALLNTLYLYSPAYMAILSDANGIGVTNTGIRVNLSEEEYFSELIESGFNTFVYVADDRITGAKAIAYTSAIPGDSGDKLISYYPLAKIGDSIRKNDFDGNIFYILLNQDGEIIAQNNDYQSIYINDVNIVEKLRGLYGDEIRRMDIRLRNGVSGSMKVELTEGENYEARSIIYTPFDYNQWYIMVGVNRDYVTRQENREREYTQRTFAQLAAVICGFIIAIVLINMISKLRNTASTKELMEKADTDLLTGLLNKVATERKIMDYFTNHPNEQAIMYVLDIDNFKKINDTMGHAFGDEVLRSLGQQITTIFRASDIIGRIGGDELIILLKNIYSDENMIKESVKVARFFHDFKAGEYVKYSATASIGAAIFPRDGKDFETMYKAGDQALYMAKKRGKNQLAFYHDTFEGIKIKS